MFGQLQLKVRPAVLPIKLKFRLPTLRVTLGGAPNVGQFEQGQLFFVSTALRPRKVTLVLLTLLVIPLQTNPKLQALLGNLVLWKTELRTRPLLILTKETIPLLLPLEIALPRLEVALMDVILGIALVLLVYFYNFSIVNDTINALPSTPPFPLEGPPVTPDNPTTLDFTAPAIRGKPPPPSPPPRTRTPLSENHRVKRFAFLVRSSLLE